MKSFQEAQNSDEAHLSEEVLLGNRFACYVLAQDLMAETELLSIAHPKRTELFQQAADLFETAAKENYPPAQTALALIYLDFDCQDISPRLAPEQKFNLAYDLLKNSEQAGDLNAFVGLALLYSLRDAREYCREKFLQELCLIKAEATEDELEDYLKQQTRIYALRAMQERCPEILEDPIFSRVTKRKNYTSYFSLLQNSEGENDPAELEETAYSVWLKGHCLTFLTFNHFHRFVKKIIGTKNSYYFNLSVRYHRYQQSLQEILDSLPQDTIHCKIIDITKLYRLEHSRIYTLIGEDIEKMRLVNYHLGHDIVGHVSFSIPPDICYFSDKDGNLESYILPESFNISYVADSPPSSPSAELEGYVVKGDRNGSGYSSPLTPEEMRIEGVVICSQRDLETILLSAIEKAKNEDQCRNPIKSAGNELADDKLSLIVDLIKSNACSRTVHNAFRQGMFYFPTDRKEAEEIIKKLIDHCAAEAVRMLRHHIHFDEEVVFPKANLDGDFALKIIDALNGKEKFVKKILFPDNCYFSELAYMRLWCNPMTRKLLSPTSAPSLKQLSMASLYFSSAYASTHISSILPEELDEARIRFNTNQSSFIKESDDSSETSPAEQQEEVSQITKWARGSKPG